MKTSNKVRKTLIEKIFRENYAQHKLAVYKAVDIKNLLCFSVDELEAMRMSTLSKNKIIDYLTKNNLLTISKIQSLDNVEKILYKTEQFNKKSVLQKTLAIAQVLYPRGYFTHATALYFNGLTKKAPSEIIINIEQDRHYDEEEARSALAQDKIDAAMSKNRVLAKPSYYLYRRYIRAIHCQAINNTSIIKNQSTHHLIRHTDLERTLIDICVRPELAGGIAEVIKIFSKAKTMQIDISKIINYLRDADYIYPYHQTIGFLLDLTGHNINLINAISAEFDKEYDFYLCHDPNNIARHKLYYTKKWKIFANKEVISKYLPSFNQA
jgi:predicted transcriptional regulator of viral defense system